MKHYTLGVSIVFFLHFLHSCERPGFIKKVDPPELVSKSYLVQEFVRNKAEIIWVIDNSGSMSTYQQSVIKNMDVFIGSFVKHSGGADWRMALLSTTKTEPPYVGFLPYDYLESSDPADAVARFNDAVRRLGTGGHHVEEAFYPIQSALKTYRDYSRKTSKLFIIVVSDELEQGGMGVDEFLNFLYAHKAPEDITTYGVFEMTEKGCGFHDYIGTRYAEFIEKTGGLTFPICSDDYGTGLATFGKDMAYKVSVSKIELDAAPNSETIKVIYQGVELSEGEYWSYNAVDNTIYFHNLDFLKGFDLEKVRVSFEKARVLDE